jgi:hypothetical protein
LEAEGESKMQNEKYSGQWASIDTDKFVPKTIVVNGEEITVYVLADDCPPFVLELEKPAAKNH